MSETTKHTNDTKEERFESKLEVKVTGHLHKPRLDRSSVRHV